VGHEEEVFMIIKHIPITDINPAPYNPRSISDAAFEGLKESIKKFGMPQPLVVNKRSGVLVSGHQRLKAAGALGLSTVPVIEVDLSPAEEKALNVTLNNKHIAGDFTVGLNELLGEITADLGRDFLAELRLDQLLMPEVNFEEPPEKKEPEGKDSHMIECPNCGALIDKDG
jgi:hypothetical protein